jgi:GTP-binding protein
VHHVVIDASEPISDQDLKILTMVEEAGKALVIAYNKWDLTDEERRRYLEREIERDLHALGGRPRQHLRADRPQRRQAQARPSTPRRGLGDADLHRQAQRVPGAVAASHPHPVRGGKQPRILFGTQAHNCPPTFALFTSGPDGPPVQALRRAPAARGVRLRRLPGARRGPRPGEARRPRR